MKKIEKRLARMSDQIERYYCAECTPGDCSCTDTGETPHPNQHIHYVSDVENDEVKSYRRS